MSSPALPPPLLTPARALRYYNLFRVASIAALLIMTQWAMPFLAGRNAWLSGWLGMYAGLVVFGALLARTHLPLSWTITLSLAGDISLLVLYMHQYGGVQSGFGMLLLPFLAVGGMLGRANCSRPPCCPSPALSPAAPPGCWRARRANRKGWPQPVATNWPA